MPSVSSQPTSDEVRKSLRRFRNHADDLQNSDGTTFTDRISRFVEFGKNDPVFSPLRQQLVGNPRVSISQWLKNEFPQGMGWMGTGSRPHFPSDDADRLSLTYQLLEWMNATPYVNLIRLFEMWFGGMNEMDRWVTAFSNAVVRPFFRDLNDRLEEIEQNLPSIGNESAPVMHFEFHDSKNVQIGNFNTQDNRE